MQTLIKNATIFNEGIRYTGSLYIRDGRIKKIYRTGNDLNLHGKIHEIDASDLWLLPGVIDDQVHFRDPGFPEKADFYTESKAAVAGGVTSVMDMPNTMPQTITQSYLQEKFVMASEKSLSNYSFYLGATNDNIEEIAATDPSHVCGIKVFMGASTGNMLVDDPGALEKIFSRAPCLVAVHCEDENTIQTNAARFREQYGPNVPISCHPDIRSEEACYRSSSLAVDLAKKHHTRLHILHLSTARELTLLNGTIPLNNKTITAEVCIHHLWFSQDDYDALGSLIKWNPAIKTKKDREALLQGILDNRIDVIATDHAPHTLDEKRRPYFDAPSGGPLIQHSLVAMLELVRNGLLTVEKVVEKMCHAPAILFGIDQRGFIREGYWADLVLVDPKKDWTVRSENIRYKCGWSPFENVTFHSQVQSTFVNGHMIYDSGTIDETNKGQALRFNRIKA